MSKVLYFSGTTALRLIQSLENARFAAIGGVRSKHNRYDSFRRIVGQPIEGPGAVLPVTRKIFFKSNPSLHKCGSRCRGAKGHDCECSCGGEFHGVDA